MSSLSTPSKHLLGLRPSWLKFKFKALRCRWNWTRGQPYRNLEAVLQRLSGFGFPETLVSDNGPQFTSDEFASYMRRIGTRHIRTAPYHPSSNGQAEHFVQFLTVALRKDPALPVNEALADFLLAYRNTPRTTTGEAPAVVLLGRRLSTRLDVVKPSTGETVSARQFTQTLKRRSNGRLGKRFSVGDSVRVRNFRRGDRWFRATILAQTGPVSYKLCVTTLRGVFQWVRHKDHIVRVPPEKDISTPLGPFRESEVPEACQTPAPQEVAPA
ncbi:uncharacterized protein K02A2.6-like [Ixodes scapularis]|uniref:uncharacterized protein K02A2.6-like n=1 Tax=Ixodes scapularis TaxID=6945 RepID=UPI001AD61A84|nr:uncharacterized protein K02A2.6-like [Ixodes scapularis]